MVLVEDNVADIFLVQQAISAHRLNVNVYIMNNGEEAMTFFRQIEADQIRCPDILLLDLNIPKVDGFSVLSYLRDSDHCRQMPVIVMTSSAASADREKSSSLAASAYFHKPSSYQEFLALGDVIKALLA